MFALFILWLHSFKYGTKYRQNVKIIPYWQKNGKILSVFQEKYLNLSRLSSLYAYLNSLNADKQTANAELKAEKSKQLSR